MKKLLAFVLVALLAACGGGGDPAAPFAPDVNAPLPPPTSLSGTGTPVNLAQCNGTPKTAVVYAGTSAYPELANIPNACVYTTPAATVEELKATVDQGLGAIHDSILHLIASGDAASVALQYMAQNPGHVAVASLWFAPFTDTGTGLKGSWMTIYLNDTTQAACQKQAAATAEYVPDICTIWTDTSFSAAERVAAIGQLALGYLAQ